MRNSDDEKELRTQKENKEIRKQREDADQSMIDAALYGMIVSTIIQ